MTRSLKILNDEVKKLRLVLSHDKNFLKDFEKRSCDQNVSKGQHFITKMANLVVNFKTL